MSDLQTERTAAEVTELSHGNQLWRHTWKSLLLILLSALVGTGLLILSEFRPGQPMDKNLERSADIFLATGKFPNLHTWCSSRLDNYSDAIMLLMAGNVSAEQPIEQAMMSYHPVMGEFDPVQIFTKHYIDGEEYEGYEPYSRYWHGYGVIYRLLLLIMDYHQIRLLNMALQVGLVFFLCVLMYRMGQPAKGMILPLLISYGMLAPTVMWMNLEYSLGLYISLTSMLAVLILYRKGSLRDKEFLVLLFSGIGTAYWDVLTYPMAALGIPLVTVCVLVPVRKIRQALARLVRLIFFWAIGYGLMWVSKWIIGTLLTGQNVFAEGISTFLLRTGKEADGEVVSVGQTIWNNVRYFLRTPVSILFFGYLLVMGVWPAARLLRKGDTMKAPMEQMVPCLMIAAIPFVWCVITRNHASIHYWLASKAFIVSTMAMMCGVRQAAPARLDIRRSRPKIGETGTAASV